jgi:hypothetical protein
MQNLTLNNTTGLIFSVYKNNELPNVNESRHHTVKEILKDRNIPYVDCIGSYKGVEEKSFLVVSKDLDLLNELVQLALHEYAQETVLLVEGQGEARLWDGDSSVRLGQMREVSLDEARNFEAYTVRLDTLKAYIAQNTKKLNDSGDKE